MQIGKGRQGVLVCEYANKQGNGLLGWIEPACENPRWIMWFDVKGNAILYTDRETGLEPKFHEKDCKYREDNNSPCTCGLPNQGAGGAVVGDPIRVKARGDK